MDVALGLVLAETDKRPLLGPDPEAARGVMLEIVPQALADFPFSVIQALNVNLRG